MAYSVVVINRRDLKKKFARPQSQLHLVDDLLIVCVENEARTQGFIYALEYEQPGMPERWLVSLPANYTARFAVYLSKYNQIVVSVSNWRTALGKNSYLLAIDAATGQEVWRYPEQKELVNLSAPVLVQDNVFVVTTGYVLLLSPENPRETVWSQPFPFTPHWFYNGITSDEAMIYISAKKSGVIGLGQQTGQVERQYGVTEGEVCLATAVDDQNLIAGTSTGQLIAFDKVATHQKWCMQVGREITTGPLINSSYVFVGTKAVPDQEGEFTYKIIAAHLTHGQSASPAEFQPLTLGANSQFHAPLTLTPEGKLLCGASDGYLYALDSNTGHKRWQHYMQSELFSSPIVSNNEQIIVASRKGVINVLRIIPEKAQENSNSPKPEMERNEKKLLLQFLREHFSISELKDLCDFELNIRAEKFKIDSIDDFTRELISYCERHGRLKELIAISQKLRPNIPWSQ